MHTTVDLIAPEALTPEMLTLWRTMVAADPVFDSPYFDPRFTQAAGRVSPGARVAVFHRGGRITGFLPHQTRGATVQPLGAPMSDYHGVIAFTGEGPDLEEAAQLLRAPRLAVGGWVGPSRTAGQRPTVRAELGDGGFEPWYAERRATFGKFFKDKERARRSMQAEFGDLRVEVGMNDPALLAWILSMKSEQYRRSARHDVFACGWTRDLLADLMRDADADFGGSIAALWAGDNLMAAEYSLHAGSSLHFWFPAYTPGLARCSPGILLTLDTIRQGADRAWKVFDFGVGEEGYKKYFNTGSRMVGEAVVNRPGLRSALSGAAVAAVNLAGEGRGERLRLSVRRRLGAIEACEIDALNQLKGMAAAAGAAVGKLSRDRAPA